MQPSRQSGEAGARSAKGATRLPAHPAPSPLLSLCRLGKALKSPPPVVVGWHNEVFASEREAVERGCELIEEGIGIISVAPLKDDPLDGLFFPLDAEGLRRHRYCRYRRQVGSC